MDKIKAFFENGTVKIVEGCIIAVASIGFILGGVKVEEIQTIPAVSSGVVFAIESLITIIQGISALKNKKSE